MKCSRAYPSPLTFLRPRLPGALAAKASRAGRLGLGLGLGLLGAASAQTLLPLDSRPATRTLPAAIGELGGGRVAVPPAELLGRAAQGAQATALLDWMKAQIGPAGAGARGGPLVVSLDALAYGGLVQSRNSPLNAEQAIANLAALRAWTSWSGQPVYAFITLPREPDATDRARNLAVVREMLRWAGEGVFAELHVAWDDALPGSPAPAEGAALAAEAPANVRVYPGADEVASMLMARALIGNAGRVAFEYSDPVGAERVIRYEGIPLTQSARNHAQATGFQVVEAGGPTPPDLTVYVYNGGDTRPAALRVSALLRRGPVAVADVASVNLGTLPMWRDLSTLRRPQNLAALAAWGTPGNNLGTALAHAAFFLKGADPARQDALLAREYANDVLFSAQLRPALRRAVPEAQMGTPEARAALLDLARPAFPLRLARSYALADASLPWGRSFEWEFRLEPQP